MQLAPLGSVPQFYQISVVKPCFKRNSETPTLDGETPGKTPGETPVFGPKTTNIYIYIYNIINIWNNKHIT